MAKWLTNRNNSAPGGHDMLFSISFLVVRLLSTSNHWRHSSGKREKKPLINDLRQRFHILRKFQPFQPLRPEDCPISETPQSKTIPSIARLYCFSTPPDAIIFPSIISQRILLERKFLCTALINASSINFYGNNFTSNHQDHSSKEPKKKQGS